MKRRTLLITVLILTLLSVITSACSPIEVGGTYYVHANKLVNPDDLGTSEWLKKQGDNCYLQAGAVTVLQESQNGALLVKDTGSCQGWVLPSALHKNPK